MASLTSESPSACDPQPPGRQQKLSPRWMAASRYMMHVGSRQEELTLQGHFSSTEPLEQLW